MAKVMRATLAEQTYSELKSRIVSGRLTSGQRLFPQQLAGELSVSPTPVKEALALLQRDGLVEGFTRGASVVRRFTADDIVQIYEARQLLELNAMRIGVERIDDAFLARMQDLHEAQMRHAERRNRRDLALAIGFDREFHEEIVSLAGNAIMMDWHRTVLRQTQTIRTHSLESYAVERSRQDHGAILAALRVRDVDAASKILRVHLRGSRDGLLARLETIFPEGT